jgi:acetolactate synthase-1/2/3 large subunit
LCRAKSPLVVAGGGVHLSAAAAALAEIQEACSLPVATTVMGKGAVDEMHPLSLGVIGYFMGPGSRTHEMRRIVEDADVILFVGARTNQNGTDSWTIFPPRARYIDLDIDGVEVGRNYEAYRLVGDARLTLEALATKMKELGLSRRADARSGVVEAIAKGVRGWRSKTHRISTEDRSPIRPERLMAEIDRAMTPETIAVADASYSSIWIANYLTCRRAGQRFLTPRGLAGLGWGLPLAIGAQFAEPSRQVISVSGDGGFAHCWAELETVVRNKLPIVMIVLNNQILGYQKHGETVSFDAYTDEVDFAPVDHAAIARACGCDALRLEDPAAFGPKLADAIRWGKPFLLDVIIDAGAHPPITMFGDRFKSPF